MKRGKYPAWNPDGDETEVVFVRVRYVDKERFRRLATRADKRFTDWCRDALLLVARATEDTESYVEELKREHEKEARERGEVEVEIRVLEDGGSEEA